MFGKKKRELPGICGVYCGACETYCACNDKDPTLVDWEAKMGMPASEIYCKGCGSDLVNEWCGRCRFRKCTAKKGVEFCFECKDFPCEKLVDFGKTRSHGALGLRNFKQLRKISVEEWLTQQEKRWTCSQCGKNLIGTLRNVPSVEQNSWTRQAKHNH